MEGKQCIMVLCDTEEEYAQLMTEFIKRHKDLPWDLHTYTDTEELIRTENQGEISMLVVSEMAYVEELKGLQPATLVVLNESGVVRWDKVRYVNKYQQADNVLKELLEIYLEIAEEQLPRMKTEFGTKFIGVYSPVHRSMQTSFAVTLSQLLAERHATLYLNFEYYTGMDELLPEEHTRDMSDLLYFLNLEQDKLRLRIHAMIQRKGRLDYIPPMRAGQNLPTVTVGEWISLMQKVGEMGIYEYVVLDLSESVQGLFDILRMCIKVFTITKEDRIAKAKLLQYERSLALCEYDDVLEKTHRCSLPQIRKMPEELEQYTRGELADYVKGEARALLWNTQK